MQFKTKPEGYKARNCTDVQRYGNEGGNLEGVVSQYALGYCLCSENSGSNSRRINSHGKYSLWDAF